MQSNVAKDEFIACLDLAKTNGHTEVLEVLNHFLVSNCTFEDPPLQKETEAYLQDARKQDQENLSKFLENPITSQRLLACAEDFLGALSPASLSHLCEAGLEVAAPIEHEHHSTRSLLHAIASWGLTELMQRVGKDCQRYEDISWVKINPRVYPDYIGPLQPILHAVCSRQFSNIGMLIMLVDTFGCDPNTRHQVYDYDKKDLKDGPAALHILAQAKHFWQLEAIQYLFERGADINAKNDKGETPLHIASGGNVHSIICDEQGHWTLRASKLLLKLGADPNLLDRNGESCLNKASSSPKIMQELLKGGADMSISSEPPMFSAIRRHDVRTVRILLNNGADVNTVHQDHRLHYNLDGRSLEEYALLCAARDGQWNTDAKAYQPIVKLLLDRGANWRVAVNEEETLMHLIFQDAEQDILEGIMDQPQIDFNTRDQRGRTIFLAACSWKECLDGYRHRHWGEKATLPAICLIDRGADINAIDHAGRNALHLLASNYHQHEEDMLQLIAREDCAPLLFQKDNDGFTPLHAVLAHRRMSVAEALVAKGADLLERDPDGLTALHHLSRGLQKVYVHIDYVGPDFAKDCIDLWRKYQELGGHIDDRSDTGDPALFTYLASKQPYGAPKFEADRCHIENFGLFFGDADVFAKNDTLETVLNVIAQRPKESHYTVLAQSHDTKLFKFLMSKGLDPLAEDARGRSSLDVAAANGRSEILELFQQKK